MPTFTGYPRQALPLLHRIGANDRTWFDEHREQYRMDIADPTKALVADLAAILTDRVSPGLTVEPRVYGSIAPITNDLRFRPGTRYKDHLMLRFWEGDDRRTAPTLFLQLGPERVRVGGGVVLGGPTLRRYREAVAADSGAELDGVLAQLLRIRRAGVDGDLLKGVPRPYPADHPRAGLLRRTGRFGVSWTEPFPRCLRSPSFVPWTADRLVRLADLHAWLRDRLG